MTYGEEITYKQLCEEMKEPPQQNGKGRQNQLNRWGKQYNIEKIGRGKYVIKREWTEDEKIELKDSENYSKYIRAILLKFIASSPELTTIYTYRDFREHLSMVNSHYFPVKYNREQLDIKTPFNFEYDEEGLKSDWFNIADAHDKYIINYSLAKLKEDGLLSSCEECYVFYKKIIEDKKVCVIKRVCTKEEKATIDQIKLEFIKSKGVKTFRDIFLMGPIVLSEYYSQINDYVRSLGFDRYAKAFAITRPVNLKKVANYFAPKFNKMQVNRYINSRRFKTIPPFFHEQMTEKLIKIENKESPKE